MRAILWFAFSFFILVACSKHTHKSLLCEEKNKQTEPKEQAEQRKFAVVENMPEYPGGQAALMKFIAENLRRSVVEADTTISGRVFVRFRVSETGTVDSVSVARGIHPAFDAEAIRVVSLQRKWMSGKARGKSEPVWFTVPVNFKLP